MRRRGKDADLGPVPLMAAILTGTADLSGAACIGHAELFDPASADEPRPAVEARHQQATEICRRCPVLGACTDYADTNPTVDGVLAQRIPPMAGRPTREAS